MKTVYLLYHISESKPQVIDKNGYLNEEAKLLGVFSSEEKALEMQPKYECLVDFQDHPNGFLMNKYSIDTMEDTKSVYLLYHTYEYKDEDLNDRSKLLDVFSSKEKALEVQSSSKNLPGFKDHPNDFLIDHYTINHPCWTGGAF